MPRPRCHRRVTNQPTNTKFFPDGEKACGKEAIVLGVDELEAVRLADLEGLYHEESGIRMGVSRPTFGRILQAAHKKIAQALIEGVPLRIEGGPVTVAPTALGRCGRCARNLAPKKKCPLCKKFSPHKIEIGDE